MTPSTMLQLGTSAPDFCLPSTQGHSVSLGDFNQAKGLVVAFICNHCPYVIHIAPRLAKLAAEYQQKGIAFVAINSNDTEMYPADSMDNMIVEKSKREYTFPYLLDESQRVAQAYSAACTPDLYLFDGQQKLVYRGQFDSSRPHRISSGNYDSSKNQATGEDLQRAMDQLLNQQPIDDKQIPSIGCNIKWKVGNEPDYFG
ncbi:thioredoxin family protein [Neptunicella sp. SCSIO 80796]|uniref:thioredoxin family protein n=1 Tax=Neptunicella plasticusilytica TaxID=3117012 RepID=UPI003A4D4A29